MVVLACAGLALLLPVIPYSLELFALRRLDAGTFGTLMSIEPAAALLVGAVMLRQFPGWGQALGIGLVTVAAVGAARTGRRTRRRARARAGDRRADGDRRPPRCRSPRSP